MEVFNDVLSAISKHMAKYGIYEYDPPLFFIINEDKNCTES
uniref:Uncharacterized protein n=1 Tax=uncultured Desulfobacterium sp. TaxID=201089 RepID=E1YBU4_9BACT|nr:unknown protein [uncultured Desulfobacterium sp.]